LLKKSMDILDVYAISHIYSEVLRDCIVDNIYYSTWYWLFKLRCRSGKSLLKIEPGVRIHLSRAEPLEKGVDKLAAFLRRHVRGFRVKLFKQLGWERIVVMELAGGAASYKLFVEILPRGFMVVADAEDKILYADRFEALRDRVIKRGEVYRPPPGWSDLESYFTSLKERIKIGRDLVRGVVKGWGLPGYVAEEILYRAGLYESKNADVSSIEERVIEDLVEQLRTLMSESLRGRGYLVEQDGRVQLYTPYTPKLFLELYDADVREFDDLNDAVDQYFTLYEKQVVIEAEKKKLESVVKSLEKTIESQKRLVEEYREKYLAYTRFDEVLSRNYPLVEEILSCANSVRRERGWEYVADLCRGVARVEKDKGLIYIVLEGFEIPLDVRLDAWKNILKYRALAGEYRKSHEEAAKHLEELLAKLEEARSASIRVERQVSRMVKPRYWFERYHWLITRSGFLVIGGRDASQNESIVRRYLEPSDIFLHADVHGAPATVVKTGGRKPTEEDLKDAAVIAGCYSRAWREGFGYVDVYWVSGEQVSKKPPAGEYLGKGAFMIYGKRNYLRIELKLALGVEEVCDSIYGVFQRVVVGPEDLVKQRSLVYTLLVPGDTSPSALADEILAEFKERAGEVEIGVAHSEILERLPGSSKIIRFAKGDSKPVEEC